MANGVGGIDPCSGWLTRVVARSGLGYEVRKVPWGHGFGRWHADLTDLDNHHRWAAWTANQALAFQAAQPNAPVFMVAKSAGSAVVVRALEQLPPNSIDLAVLLAPALSPTYDLSAALRAVKDEIVAFWSPFDVFMLGLGTLMFGTVDRVCCRSAGLVGFRLPPDASADTRKAYRRLRQVPWRVPMAITGYCGGHFGTNLPTFLARYVLPLLRPAGAS